MPKPKAHSTHKLLSDALYYFWEHGYNASSMDQLVKATGVSRHGIYSDFESKRGLYLKAFGAYQTRIVTPAFEQVEAKGAKLVSVERYFETQISLAEKIGLPGPGCFVANAMIETAPHDQDVQQSVQAHNRRLWLGFANVLVNEAPGLPKADIRELADFLTVSAQGLWSMSRTVSDAAPLRQFAKTLISLINTRLTL